MNSLNLLELAKNTELQNRVSIILRRVCLDIIGESEATPSTQKRQSYAIHALNTTNAYIDRFCHAIVTQVGIANNISINSDDPNNVFLEYSGTETATPPIDGMDKEILNAISTVFNDLAGVTSV